VATVPTPKTWADDTVPTAAEFNAHIKDTINFIANPRWVQVRNTSDVDLSKDTWHLMSWDTTVSNNDTMRDGSFPSRLIAKTAGFFLVHLSCAWEADTVTNPIPSGCRGIQIRKNSGGTVGGTEICSDRRNATDYVQGPGGADQSCSGFVQLSVNDYVEAYCRHGTDNIVPINDNIQILQGTHTAFVRFSAVWVSSGV
jgi:hypothetical protein